MKRNNRHVESQQVAGPKLHHTLCVPCALICALFVIMPAGAERNDRTKPVNLEADRVTVDESKQTAVFEGNVVLTQGTLILRGVKRCSPRWPRCPPRSS